VQSDLRLPTHRERTGTVGKRAKQRIALDIYHASTVPLDSLHDLVMPRQRVGVLPFPYGPRKSRTALDIGEQERHLAARERDPHHPKTDPPQRPSPAPPRTRTTKAKITDDFATSTPSRTRTGDLLRERPTYIVQPAAIRAEWRQISL
jgi:hypothetical protein